jgi:hypothetical protein
MLGARMHYAVPRILHQLGCLEGLYTDSYIGNKPALELLLGALPAWMRTADVNRLEGRRDSAIPGELVTSFDTLGVRYAFARRRARDDSARAATFEDFNHRFNRAVVRRGFGAADTVWGFNTASSGIFRAAHARGLSCILEQTILPSLLEHRLLREVAEECRGWQPNFRVDDGRLQHLEQAEWELADMVVAGSQFVADGLEACGVARDRIRHGTTSLFAALDIATGAVIGKCYKRHRATEYLDFLKKLDAAMPEGPKVHLVMDNSATQKTPKIKAWLARRPHWHVQFTPTSASWINQVERWFAELTRSPAGWLASDNLVAGRPGL